MEIFRSSCENAQKNNRFGFVKNDEDVLLPFVRTAKADNKGPGRLVSSRVEETKQITGFMSDREVSLNLSQPATM